jgi:hypothetical protein
MGSYIAKWVGKKLIQDKILKERLENQFGVDVSLFFGHQLCTSGALDTT